MKLKEDDETFKLDEQAKEYATQDEYMTEAYLSKRKRDTATKIWRNNYLGNTKFVNVGSGAGIQSDGPAELVRALFA